MIEAADLTVRLPRRLSAPERVRKIRVLLARAGGAPELAEVTRAARASEAGVAMLQEVAAAILTIHDMCMDHSYWSVPATGGSHLAVAVLMKDSRHSYLGQHPPARTVPRNSAGRAAAWR